ncbi:hemolysin family protein [Pseudobacter ginsenosidimutans]|uniref:Putative hemolysin n=1 Tax=Pseudobacter ginsenosidimutans TaxID=661488 RepID=A0A4V2F1U5_9BACT|nr:hemolysin family protein [Pseudobacter ginsenosidimutans]QEC43597.1 HlyC/CorC family transporter [Pseudobacter ginsenosidimutans]RZS74996.1 putative hemolysin [Pseudobacter ginsenosidimutans]
MEILIILLLILINGIFSMSEIALVSSRKFKLEAAARKGNSNARKALELANNPNTFLSTVQIGITLIGILTGIFSGDTITVSLKLAVEKIDVLRPYANTIAVAAVVVAVTFLSIVFGELLPKRIGLMFPEKIAATVAKPMTLVSVITRPFIWLLTKTNDLFLAIFGLKGQKEGIVSEEEIKAMVQESAEGGEIDEIEQSIVQRVFALGDRRVSELMTHRGDLIWFNLHDDLKTVKRKAGAEKHSVYIVCRNSNLDDLAGIVSVKDIFPDELSNETFNLSGYLKAPLIVHESTPAYKVLEQFKEKKLHYAVVIDEYGTVQGMVAMDDVLDALLGDSTEYNQEEYSIQQRDDHSWLADGQYPFFEFLHYFDIGEDDAMGNYNTLSGLFLDQVNHIPTAGEKIRWREFAFEVMDMDGPRIDKLLITRKS